MNRLFIAIPIPGFILNQVNILKESTSSEISKLRWERKEKIHLTLKFIGDVSDEMTKLISETLLFLCDYEKINLSLTKFNFFPNSSSPKILYIELAENEKIIQIVNDLNQTLSKIGIIKSEKTFHPHLTLLRIKRKLSDSLIKSLKELEIPPLDFIADEISLYRSKLMHSGSEYTRIKTYNLK